MSLKIRHLEVFNALYEAGSVSQAALRLNLTQPAVSIALSNLEDQLGYRLFHRNRGFFAPTAEAAQLRGEITQGLMALARIDRRADEIRQGWAGGVSIATNGVMAMNLLPRAIAAFQTDHPGTHIEMRVHSSRQIADWTASGQIDIGLIDAPVPAAGLTGETFAMECVCIMPQDDPLAAHEAITPANLAGRAIVGVNGDHVVDRQLKQLMFDAGMPLGYTSFSYYFAIARNMVAAGSGLSIIDPINGKADLHDGVIWRPFAPRIVHETVMIASRDHAPGQGRAEMQDHIRRAVAPFTLLPD
ncbi:LysR family transcriptional regulator [Pelagivirga sediminicola]|uniref:LysR family transcriptional regulator n=1 Tax=Pelagivirga sediminicola TaxID=2170575 RepID=A0A2T7G3V2_9RHOB|nr:LysR substrate-binding domain-containing protein [Pelagivirga sediminicola]PVA09101.1 LysR family transcriptional regulator [Pelagivirga sediminicola]